MNDQNNDPAVLEPIKEPAMELKVEEIKEEPKVEEVTATTTSNEEPVTASTADTPVEKIEVVEVPGAVNVPNPIPTEEAVVSEPQEPDMFTARTEETGDKVYLIRQGKRYWVKNPETLKKMGFYLGQEKKISFSELLQCPEGDPIDLTPLDAIYPWDKPEGETNEPTNPHRIWS